MTNSTNLNQVILETIQQSKQVLGEGFDFAKEQTPLVINEFLLWRFWQHAINGTALLLGVAVSVWFLIKVWKWAIKHGEDNGEELVVILPLLLSGLLLIPLSVGSHHVLSAVKVKLAPRVYLIEYIADAVKK